MSRLINICILTGFTLSSPCTSFSQTSQTKVAIIGSLHEYHHKLKGYSFQSIKKLISSKKPDVICIEVKPENYKGKGTKFAPYEYREVLMPFLLKTGAKIEPFDWGNEDWSELMAEQKSLSKDPKTSGLFKAIINPVELLLKHSGSMEIAELDHKFFNSPFMDDWISSAYSLLSEAFPGNKISKIANERNRNMARLLIAAIRRNPGKKILVLVGIEHKYALKDALQQIPLILYLNIEEF